MSIKYRLISQFVRMKKRFEHKPRLNEREKRVISIFEELYRNHEVDLFVAPITGNRYIVAQDNSLSIILTGENAIISNHQYYYDISLGFSAGKILFSRFDKILESRIRKYEKEIMLNMLKSLDNIATSIREKSARQ